MTLDISPIDAANALTPHWMKTIREYDALKIHPCAVIGKAKDGTQHVEVCDAEEAHFWTVYGHLRSGGISAFEDFPTQAEAIAFYDRLIAAYPHLAY